MQKGFRKLLISLLAGWGVFVLVLCATPPVSRDALVHHLAVPKLYLTAVHMVELPEMPYSYFPGNLDLLYLIPLYFKVDFFAKYIHFCFALITAAMIYRYLKRRCSPVAGLLGALLFLSIPLITKLSTTAYVDLGLVCFSCASLLGLFEWAEKGCRINRLLWPAVWCGLALGTKYNGLVCWVLLTLTTCYLSKRNDLGEWRNTLYSLVRGGCFAVIALVVFSPWMIRNTLWTGNPIYPLYNSVFNPPVAAPAASNAGATPDEGPRYKVTPLNYRRDVYQESFIKIVAVPLRIFFQGEDGNMRLFDGRLTPVLLLSCCAFIRTRSSRERHEKIVLSVFSLLTILITLFQTVFRVRYMAYALPAMTMLSVYGGFNLWRVASSASHRWMKFTLKTIYYAFIVAGALWSVSYAAHLYMYVDPLAYISGAVDRDAYISRYRFEHPATQFINQHLPENAVLYNILLGKRGYYLNRKYIPDVTGHTDQIRKLIGQQGSPESLIAAFQRMGVTHWVINERLFMKRVNATYSEKQLRVLRAFFFTYMERLYQDRWVGVYALSQ
ncbi:MAG: hypothetical protein CSA22_04740 [Deltaproteobacteria bacterium]|nr:MAG: hypothetical protein CSA22_04740 [Deltaproteobacteria bacterium]